MKKKILLIAILLFSLVGCNNKKEVEFDEIYYVYNHQTNEYQEYKREKQTGKVGEVYSSEHIPVLDGYQIDVTKSVFEITIKKDVNLEYYFKPLEFTITFDGNGGTLSPNFKKQTGYYGQGIPHVTASKPGYKFIGWENAPDVVTQDITLKAKFNKINVEDMAVTSKIEIYPNRTHQITISFTPTDALFDSSDVTYVSSNEEIAVVDEYGNIKGVSQGTATISITYLGIKKTTNVTVLDGSTQYRKLETGKISSNYLYTGYETLTDRYFEGMDIIYCAFVKPDVNGEYIGKDAHGANVANKNKYKLSLMSKYVIPKAHEHKGYVIASLGGGGSSNRDTFSIIAKSDALRKKFAKNTVDLINTYGFDGIDIDWETPTYAEKENFRDLMEELYKAVKKNNPRHLVTAAIGGGMWAPPNYLLSQSKQYLDYVNMMTYSMSDKHGYYQNALYQSSSYDSVTYKVGKTLSSCSIVESISIYKAIGFPKEKIIIGFALYGVKQTRANVKDDFTESSNISYSSVKKYYIGKAGYKVKFDNIAKVPYILSNDGLTFISYDNYKSIELKSKYVKDNNLAGAMYWQHGGDNTKTLMEAMFKVFGK